jgi:signal transduction histidine kinase
MWVKLSILQKGLVLIAAPLLFQLIFFALLADMQRGNAQAVAWSIHSKEVLRQTQVVLRNLLELGTGLRGFILAADGDLGAAYERAARQLPLDIAELRNRVRDNPEQTAQVDSIAEATREYMAWHAETVRLSAAGQREQAIERAKSDTNSRLQNTIVKAMRAFIRTEDDLDKERTQALERSRQWQQWMLIFGAGVTLLITLGLAFVFSRSISGRLTTLADNAQRLVRDEELAPPLKGSDEVARLDRSFRGMAQEIAQTAQSLRRSAEEVRTLYEQARKSEQEIRRLNEDLEARIAERTAELGRANEALREADRRKDDFLATLAHELRNPLAPVRNALHILKVPGLSDEAADKAREMMERQIEHLVRLVDDLLDVSRIVRGKVQLHPERLEMGQLVRLTAEDCRPVLENAGLTLRLDTPDVPIWVHGDAIRLAQILNNLLDNAVKFSDGGQSVAVRVSVDAERRQAVLTVRDEGIGIEPSVLPRLFTPFAQADQSIERSPGGLGLGLALVKGLAELHGGQVRCVSEGRGRGTEFTVCLPLMPEPAALSSTPSTPRHLTGDCLRILVIEDHRDAAESLRLMLEMLGHQVHVAYSGPEGVQAAGEWQPDIVLCDIGLPGLDGYGVARQLRLNPTTARVRLLALTGYGTAEARQRSQEAGFDHHLVKPADPRELQRLLAPG